MRWGATGAARAAPADTPHARLLNQGVHTSTYIMEIHRDVAVAPAFGVVGFVVCAYTRCERTAFHRSDAPFM